LRFKPSNVSKHLQVVSGFCAKWFFNFARFWQSHVETDWQVHTPKSRPWEVAPEHIRDHDGVQGLVESEGAREISVSWIQSASAGSMTHGVCVYACLAACDLKSRNKETHRLSEITYTRSVNNTYVHPYIFDFFWVCAQAFRWQRWRGRGWRRNQSRRSPCQVGEMHRVCAFV